jgi:hypothetical protein
MSLFHLYAGGFGALVDMRQRSLHLAFALVLCFLHFPLLRRWKSSFPVLLFDLLLAFVAGAVALYPFLLHESMLQRVGSPGPLDVAVAVTLTVLILEATRRSISWMLPVVALVFMLYALMPQEWLPELVAHRGYSLRRVMDHLFMATEGIFGIPLGVSATYVFLFVFFGTSLEALGAGKYLIDLSVSMMGRFRGGPAKAAVVASGTMGTISGSSIANTVTTGVITIPLMRKIGFPAVNAGAVEVAASTNGQLVPPVMGAAAFIMAETLGIGYGEVVRAADSAGPAQLHGHLHDRSPRRREAGPRRHVAPGYPAVFLYLLSRRAFSHTPGHAARAADPRPHADVRRVLFHRCRPDAPDRRDPDPPALQPPFHAPAAHLQRRRNRTLPRVARRFGSVFVIGARNMIGIAAPAPAAASSSASSASPASPAESPS